MSGSRELHEDGPVLTHEAREWQNRAVATLPSADQLTKLFHPHVPPQREVDPGASPRALFHTVAESHLT